MTSKRNSVKHADFSAILSPKIVSPQLGLSIQLRQMPDGGSVELLPEPFAQLEFGQNVRFYVATIHVAANLQSIPVLVVPVPKGSALPAVVQQGLRKHSDAAHHYLPKVTELKTISTENITHFLPTLYCKRVNVFFHAVCPDCAGNLANAPESVLAEHRASQPAIYCSVCYQSGGDNAVIYQDIKQIGHDSKNVEDQRKLVARYSAAMEKGAITQNKIPCANCSHKAQCYPVDNSATGATRLLVPFSFTEFSLYAIEHAPLRINEYAALLSGQTWSATQQKLTANHEFDRLQLIQANQSLQEAIFGLTASQNDNESNIASAKLKALYRVAHAIHDLRKTTRAELGSIRAENIFVDLTADKWSGDQPSRAVVMFAPMPTEFDGGSSVSKHKTEFAKKQVARVVISEINGNDEDGYTILIKLESPSLGSMKPTTGDTVILYFGINEGFASEMAVSFNVDQINEHHIQLTSTQPFTDKQQVQQLRALRYLPYLEIAVRLDKQQIAKEVTVETADKDLLAFGHVFFSTLFANKQGLDSALDAASNYFNTNIWSAASQRNIVDLMETFTADKDSVADIFRISNANVNKEQAAVTSVSIHAWSTIVAIGMKLRNVTMPYSYQSACISADDKWTIFNRVMSDIENALILLNDGTQRALVLQSSNPVASRSVPSLTDDEIDSALRDILQDVISDESWLQSALSSNVSSKSASQPVREAQKSTRAPNTEKSEIIRPSVDMNAEGATLEETVILSKDMLNSVGLGSQSNAASSSKRTSTPVPKASSRSAAAEKSPIVEDLEATMIISRADLQKP